MMLLFLLIESGSADQFATRRLSVGGMRPAIGRGTRAAGDGRAAPGVGSGALVGAFRAWYEPCIRQV
jgi:hypothetical protein